MSAPRLFKRVLVPKLLAAGYDVRVFDLFLYGQDVFNGSKADSRLELVKADLRDLAAVRKAVAGCDAAIHLACISNDPSFELDPALGKAVNYDCFDPFVQAARDAGVKRLIYASTSSVYGVSEVPDVAEDHPLRPLTDYSKYKALCEEVVAKRAAPGFDCLVLRPATVCGWSPRLRLDLTVNLLTHHAVNKGKITVFGGRQKRPNIHIEDVTDLYVRALELPAEKIAGKTYNAGYQNLPVGEIAELVRKVVAEELPDRPAVPVVTTPSDDNRSYHISSGKIAKELGFAPRRTIEQAVRDLVRAFTDGRVADPEAVRYYNIKTMQTAGLK